MASQSGSDFTPPEVALGDKVLWYDNPLNLQEPQLGWVSRRPGSKTVCVLTFSESFGWIEKTSVRHADDPGLQENASWRQWGCWSFHPETDLLRKMGGLLPQIVALLARQGSKNKD
jgi:hypothetical protein